MTIVAVAVAALSGASIWAALCGAAALVLLAVSGDSVMARVLARGDADVVRYSLRQIVSSAIWTSAFAYALGAMGRLIMGN